MELDGKVAIVTGGSSGIGRAIASLFIREGSRVVVADITYNDTVIDIREKGASCLFFKVDVRKSFEVKRLVKACVDQFGKIDIVCNDAGIELLRPLVDTPEEEWDRVVDTNLKGPFLVSKYSLPYMIQRSTGNIINIASQLGLVGSQGFSAYCASKAGVILLTKVMALEYARYGIRVNCVCPGAINTPMVERELRLDPDPKKASETMMGKHPIGRLGKPEEVAQAVLFLASHRSSFVTGSSLVVDGGYTIM
jgi:NAD(P)-dependent dehydrogenase (short-subunit alcohol dehydrogenase family)